MAKSPEITYSSDQGEDNTTLLSTAAQESGGEHYARSAGVEFMPSTWRIASFANNRIAQPTDRVVYIPGDWDLFHAGHVEILMKAKELGDFILVGVWPGD